MPLEVVVALIANPGDPFRSQAPESEWNRPYAERTKVTLAVAEDESLAEVLERAAAQLSLVPPTDFVPQGFSATRSRVAFYRPDDEAGFGERYVPRFLLGEVTLVDGGGRVIFGARNLRAITYRELLAAAEAGVLGGDPLRPYLIIEVGYGDMPPPDLALLLEGLAALRETMQVVVEAGGALMVAKWVRDAVRHRLRRGQEALEKNKEWIHRGYSPYQFVALIRSRAWTTHELATALGCGADEAEAMLWVLGFAQDPENGRWVPGGDEPAEVLRQLQTEFVIAGHDRTSDWTLELQRRTRAYLETGEPPGIARPDGSWDDFEDDLLQPTAGERVGAAVDLAVGAIRRMRDRHGS